MHALQAEIQSDQPLSAWDFVMAFVPFSGLSNDYDDYKSRSSPQ